MIKPIPSDELHNRPGKDEKGSKGSFGIRPGGDPSQRQPSARLNPNDYYADGSPKPAIVAGVSNMFAAVKSRPILMYSLLGIGVIGSVLTVVRMRK